MVKKIVASTAFLAGTALAQGAGSASVINNCDYPIWVANVPASGGGYSQIGPNSLSNGQSYTQTYTQLSNLDGWSIKIAKDSGLSQVMQYEYTFHNDGIIWFDMSEVNGDPFDGDWDFTATGDCTPKQTAYQYSTDDAYGMQSCPDTSSITVTMCGSGGNSGGGGSTGWGSSPAAPPASAPTSAAPSSAYTPSAAPAPSSPSAPYVPSAPNPVAWNPAASGGAFEANAAAASPASTLATIVQQNAAHTVTNMHTVVVTEYITASPVPAPAAKRHEHLHRHMAHHH